MELTGEMLVDLRWMYFSVFNFYSLPYKCTSLSISFIYILYQKQSIISPCYNSSGSWTMLSPSSIIPSYEVSSSHLVDQSGKVFNDENILSIGKCNKKFLML